MPMRQEVRLDPQLAGLAVAEAALGTEVVAELALSENAFPGLAPQHRQARHQIGEETPSPAGAETVLLGGSVGVEHAAVVVDQERGVAQRVEQRAVLLSRRVRIGLAVWPREPLDEPDLVVLERVQHDEVVALGGLSGL